MEETTHLHFRERSQKIAEALAPFVQSGLIAGAVAAVADKDEILGLATVGLADIGAQTPMQPETFFWVASQTKPITATLVMMLAEEEKIGLDDPVESFIPAFRDSWVTEEQDDVHWLLKKAHRPITVRDLLRHTSGLPFASPLEKPTFDMLTLPNRAAIYAAMPLQFQPGTQYAYSNAGVNIAGRIIEIVTDLPYETVLERRLLQPLGLRDTTFHPHPAQLQRLAKSYKRNPDQGTQEEIEISQLHYPLDAPARQPMPAGGLFSTVTDMTRFCQMFLNGGTLGAQTYLSAASVAEMTRRQTDVSIPENHGLCWGLGEGTFGHSGAFNTNMTIHADRGLVTVFLVQQEGQIGQTHAAFLEAALSL